MLIFKIVVLCVLSRIYKSVGWDRVNANREHEWYVSDMMNDDMSPTDVSPNEIP
jgi:hypothetical protein